MNNKAIKFIKIQFSALFFIVLGLLGLYVLSVRAAIFYLEDHKLDLEDILSQNFSRQTTIRSLDSSWVGFDPVVDINGLSVAGTDHSYVGRVRLRFSFLESLRAFSPVIDSVSLDHSEISLHQSPEGGWSIASFDLSTLGDSQQGGANLPGGFIETLIGKTRFQVNDLLVSLHDKGGHVRSLRLPATSLAYLDNKVFINGSIIEKGTDYTLLNFSLEGEGVLDARPLSSKVYIEARSTEFIGRFLQVYKWEDLSISEIDGNLRVWLEIDGFEVTDIQGQVQLSELNWRSGENNLTPLTNIAANFKVSQKEKISFVDINGLSYQVGEQRCESSDSQIEITSKTTIVKSTAFDLHCLSSIAVASQSLPSDLHERLEVSKPSGLLDDVHLVIYPSSENKFKLIAGLTNVALEAYDGTPGGSGITGFIEADANGGAVSFASSNFTLAFPDLFLESWSPKFTEGYVNWLVHDNGNVDVFSEGLRLRFADDSLVYGDFFVVAK